KLHLLSPTISRVNAPEIQQVVLNLLNNAIQALSQTPHEPKEITVETAREGDKNILTIADNGKGVPKERQTKLFELASGSQHNGMGLGLWLCKQIVSRNSGTISYVDGPSGGARFIVKLPHFTT
ncbi:ATP-binding protein, partial [Zwartia sp.]|uniref:sensor histidine kinase n=1 Tax=Zwartia sp. TaxID=2978004 RepID=UPI00271F9FCB